MSKKDKIKIFFDKIFSEAPKKNFFTNKIVYNHIDKIWSFDLAYFSDYKTSNNKGFIYIFFLIDNFSKNLWAILLKNEYGQTITNEFSNILTTSKRRLLKLESDRGAEWYISVFQNFLKIKKNIHHYSRFTDKRPNIAERVIRTIRNLLQKPVFEKRIANWLSELSAFVNKNNNTFHHSIKMTPNQASEKANE